MSERIRLTDRSNQTIGYIEQQTDGNQRLMDRSNQTLGYYDAKSNRTMDRSSQTIGHGNLLTTLLS